MPLAQATLHNVAAAGIARPLKEHGQPLPIFDTAESGYVSEANVRDVTALGLAPYYATGRQNHQAPHEALLPETAPAAPETPKEAMSGKLRTESSRLVSAARNSFVEPVFGQIKRMRGLHQFLLRGLELITAEWQVICLAHN